MKGYQLTIEQKESIQGQYYTEYQFFNCVQDINGVWFLFLSEEDKPEVAASEYSWVLNLPTGEYIPPLPPPFPPII
jgi:hypothetical protein